MHIPVTLIFLRLWEHGVDKSGLCMKLGTYSGPEVEVIMSDSTRETDNDHEYNKIRGERAEDLRQQRNSTSSEMRRGQC